MRTFVWILCIFVFACAYQIARADEPVEVLLKESSERARAMKTLTARIDLSWQTPRQGLQRNIGTISLMKPNYALIKLSGDYPLIAIASDGQSRYLLSEPTKYTLAAADRVGKNIDTPWWMLPARFFFTQNLKPFGPESPDWKTERYVGEEIIEREKFSLIEISDDQPMPYVARFYFDASKILRRSVVRFGEEPGAAIFTCVIADVRSPKHLRPSNFKYRPPVTAKLDTGAEARMLALGDQGPDFSLPTSDGKQLNLASVRQGSRATLINFWYLGCPPCRAEFEFFQRLYSSLRTKGFSIIAINKIDEAADIQTFMRQNRLSFPVVLGERDGPGVMGAYRVETYPSTYLLNSEGKVVYRSVGVDEAGLRQALRELGLPN
jgi:peroxiredoxin